MLATAFVLIGITPFFVADTYFNMGFLTIGVAISVTILQFKEAVS